MYRTKLSSRIPPDRYTGPSCMSTNTIIVTCNAVLSLVVTSLTVLPCTKKTTGGVVPALLQSAIGRKLYLSPVEGDEDVARDPC